MIPVSHALDLTPQQLLCRNRYGFWLSKGGPDNQWYLYVPAGEAIDGAPQTLVRRADVFEVGMWADGEYDRIAKRLVAEHILVPAQPAEPKRRRFARLRRLWDRFRSQSPRS